MPRNAPGELVKHKLQVHFDTHECEPSKEELTSMADDLDSLAKQVGNFPMADLRIVIERNTRSNEYSLKLTLLLPGETLVTSDHDRLMHAAFERALGSLEAALHAYKDRLNQVEERRKHENGTHQDLTPSVAIDAAALDSAVAAGDYPAFRKAIDAYADPLRLRAGRWVERYPAVQALMGRGLETMNIVEGVFLAAFEGHDRRPPGVRYSEWLEGLLDPVVKAIERHPDEELENINMARSACAASS